MPQPIKRHLRVGGAPEYDEGELVIRMHKDDLPKGIQWDDYIHLNVRDIKLTCKVRTNELAEVPQPRVHQVNINRALRQFLKIKTNSVYDFYVTKACSWKSPSYVMQYHPKATARRNMRLKVFGIIAVIIAAAAGVASFYFLWY
ncbi:MAG: hypothetical protein SVO26_03610 [Chloroflexota bacterium]|nr:hypothetical protein [Chloroflexota bacterium]